MQARPTITTLRRGSPDGRLLTHGQSVVSFALVAVIGDGEGQPDRRLRHR